MSSALACLGLAVSDDDEFDLLLKHALLGLREIGTFGGVYVGRWQDDSGAALTLGLRDGQVADFTFGYTGTSGGLVADCRLIHEAIAWAQVTDEAGQQVTAMAFEAEQYRQLAADRRWVAGPARITALGLDVTVYPGPEAFAASPASQVHLAPSIASPPPPDWDGPWPPRLAAESFTSYAGIADHPHLQSRHLAVRHRPGRHPPRQRAHRPVLHRRHGPHRRIRGHPVLGWHRPPGPTRTRHHHRRHRRPVRRHRHPRPDRHAGMTGEDRRAMVA